jgi:hypothetical protein
LNATSCGFGWWCDDEQDPNFRQKFQDSNGGVSPSGEKEPDSLKLFRQYEATRRTSDDKIKRSDDERNDGDLIQFSITDYSGSRPLTATNELHAVSAAHPVWSRNLIDHSSRLSFEIGIGSGSKQSGPICGLQRWSWTSLVTWLTQTPDSSPYNLSLQRPGLIWLNAVSDLPAARTKCLEK